MFEQAVNVGPGTPENLTNHTLEIIIMLLGAFLLGLWFGWLLWSKYKQKVDALATENESLNASLTTLRNDLSVNQKIVAELESANTSAFTEKLDLSAKNLQLINEVETLKGKVSHAIVENNELEGQLVNAITATPEVPIEIVKSPIDVHLEDLIVAPHAEPVTDNDHIDHIAEVSGGAEPLAEPQNVLDLDLPVVIDDFADLAPEAVSHELNIASEQPIAAPEAELINTAAEPAIEEPVVEEPVVEEPVVEESVQISIPEVKETVLAEVKNTVEPTPINVAPMVVTTAALATSPIKREQEIQTVVSTPVVVSIKDDLKVIEGIGPKIEEILHNNQIMTYAQLSGTPVSRLKEVLMAQGSRFAVHDPSTWPAQALLAANEEWENLKAYQNYLNSGKKPD